MVLYLLFLVNLIRLVDFSMCIDNNYNIQIDLLTLKYDTIFTVLRDQSFDITLMNYNDITKAKCKTNSHDIGMDLKYNVDHSMFKVFSATSDMNGKWQCWFWIQEIKKPLTCMFYVRVKGLPQRVNMEIGGKKLETNLTIWSESEYDEIGEYFYKNGETVQLECYNTHDVEKEGDIYLRYYDSQGIKLIETDLSSKKDSVLYFQKTMGLENNNHMIDCTFVRRKDLLMYPYRVIFKLDTVSSNTDNIATIAVNDIKLTPTSTVISDEGTIFIMYSVTVVWDQLLTVTCEVSNKLVGTIEFLDKRVKQISSNWFTEKQNDTWRNTIQFHTDIFKKTGNPFFYVLVLDADRKAILRADISLKKSDIPQQIILGLNARNVLQQYSNSSETWVIDYRYKVGEVVNLTCVTRHHRYLSWTFGSSTKEKGFKTISHSFILEEEHNESLITCKSFKSEATIRNTIIKLHLNPLAVPDDPNSPDEVQNYSNLIALAIGGLILAVAVMAIVYYCFRYRRNKRTQTSNGNTMSERVVSRPVNLPPLNNRPENNYICQEYYVHNFLYEPNRSENDESPEYHYIDVDKVIRNSSNPESTSRVSKNTAYVNQQPNSSSNCKRPKEAERFITTSRSLSADTETYDYAYDTRSTNKFVRK